MNTTHDRAHASLSPITAEPYPSPPAGYTPLGTGHFEPSHVPVAVRTSRDGRRPRIIAHDVRGWLPVAPVIWSDGTVYRVHCPSCPAPRLRKRKAPRPFHETVATHTHGHVDDSDVQYRAAHHAGPEYAILDIYGVFARTPSQVQR